MLLLVNPVICDENFFALLCGHPILKFPAVDVGKAKKLSHFFAIIISYKPKMFAFSHVFCKPLMVKACMQMPSFAIKEMVQRSSVLTDLLRERNDFFRIIFADFLQACL